MMNELPKDWKWVKLGEIGKIISGGTPSTAIQEYWNGKVNWISPADLTGYKKKTIINGAKSISEVGLKNSSARLMPKGSVLFSSRAPIGYVVIAGSELSTNQGFKSIIPNENVDSDYIYYFLKGAKQKAEKVASGTTFKEISLGKFSELEFPLPPKPTQQAIVSKIEELFSELDKSIENLRTAQLQLKTYRQAVLKWAYEGKLTNGNLKEGELPKGWKVARLKEIASDISDGDHQAPPKSKSGVPFITISNVNKDNNRIDFTDTFSVNEEYYEKLKINRKPLKGDVLYTVTGSFGIPIIIDFDKPFCFQRHIGLVRPLETTNQKWLYYLLQSPDVFNQAKSTATGTAQKTVALNSLRNFEVPYCKIEEQNKIVEEIDSRLSVADKMEESITQSLQQAEALRQSILKKAFEGRLV